MEIEIVYEYKDEHHKKKSSPKKINEDEKINVKPSTFVAFDFETANKDSGMNQRRGWL